MNETKSVKSTIKQASDDDLKLANVMKDALDDLYESNLGDKVLGVLVEGTKVNFYVMDLKYHSIYRLYKSLTCYIPVDENDFGRIPKLFTGLLTLESHFISIKDHISNIAVQKYTRSRLLSPPRVMRLNEPSFLSPTKYPKP